eukprot:TRINITY_DN728_c0_g1_i3.p1 TRINITY_DN728_c0_g1~~TRINITY_DN728_c0_g1_i3.p1  ORF type:complete len:232 (-),score=51.43 TRINITY_DN728_c0_g1_i3:78-773(-)
MIPRYRICSTEFASIVGMGVPFFFKWLCSKYPGVVNKLIRIDCDNLYLDFNSILHQFFHPSDFPPPNRPNRSKGKTCVYRDGWSEKAQELCFKLNGSLIMGKMIIVDRAPAPPKEKFSFVKTDDVEDNNYRTSKVAPSVSLTLKSRNSSGADNEENDSVTDDTEDDGDDGTVDNEENDTDGAHEETINTTTTTPVEESDEQSNDSSVINPSSSSPSTESTPPSAIQELFLH